MSLRVACGGAGDALVAELGRDAKILAIQAGREAMESGLVELFARRFERPKWPKEASPSADTREPCDAYTYLCGGTWAGQNVVQFAADDTVGLLLSRSSSASLRNKEGALRGAGPLSCLG